MTMVLTRFLALSFFTCSVVGAVTTLTDETWVESVQGKSVFIFFDEPENDACEELQEPWAKLTKDWEGHSVGLVARVDCGDPQSEILCEEYGMVNLPLLLYGDPDSPEFYDKDDMSYEALSAFAKEHINKPPCNIQNLDHCGDVERKTLTELLNKSRDELEAIESNIDLQVEDIERKFDAKIAAIQAEYTKIIKQFNDDLDNVRKETNYKWVQQVLRHLDLQDGETGGEEL